jgi:hypothetical protein
MRRNRLWAKANAANRTAAMIKNSGGANLLAGFGVSSNGRGAGFTALRP